MAVLKFEAKDEQGRPAQFHLRINPDGTSVRVDGPVPEGAVRIHLYDFENVLRPRGGVMKKESVSLTLNEMCQAAVDSWIDPYYGDSRPKGEVIDKVIANLCEEVALVIRKLNERR